MSDSDWQVRCSTSGYAFFIANAIVAYLSKKQPTIALSSAQAEIYAASLAGLEATFMAGFLHQVTGRDVTPIDLGVRRRRSTLRRSRGSRPCSCGRSWTI